MYVEPIKPSNKSINVGKLINSTDKKSNIDLLVKITSVVLCIFLTVYFIFTLNNMSAISSRVENCKIGSYPVSVAAGHLETDLAVMMSVTQLVIDMNDYQLNNETLEQHFMETKENMDYQMGVLQTSETLPKARFDELNLKYEELTSYIDEFMSLSKDESNSDEVLSEYALNTVKPVIQDMFELDDNIIDSAQYDIDDMYEYVNQAVRQTIILSLVLIAAVFLISIIYLNLLNKKQASEDQLTRDLSDALKSARNANYAKSAFLGNMSHDIRTPLNAIIGLTKIAEDSLDDRARIEQCLRQITTSSHHLLRLINDVLDMSKIESGKASLAEETFSLGDLMSEISIIVEPQAKEKYLDVQFILRDIRHEYLVGDPMRIKQVLLNLTSNAVKYTNEGDSMRVIVTELPSADPTVANLRFEVKDTGLGMKSEFLKYIFDPFERERNDFTNFIEGTGLGMAITKNLVNMMDGDIEVESELGLGSTFTVSLSLKIAEEMPHLDTEPLHGKRILAIDDDAASREQTLEILDEFGTQAKGKYPGEITEDSPLAEIVHLDAGFDIVIVDIGVSDEESVDYVKNRLQVLFREAGVEKMPPVILVLDNWRHYEEEGREAGAVVFVEKPLFRSRLYEALKAVVDVSDFDDDSSEDSEIEKTSKVEKTSKPADDTESASKPESSKADKDNISASKPKKEKSKKPKLKGRVLIVEDNEINMDIAQVLVGKFGPEVEGAIDGLDAVNKVKEAPEGYYDLIFMDWQMPHMNGIDATKEIIKYLKENNLQHIPIVAMTANAFNEDKRVALDAGMDGFMSKPIDVEKLEGFMKEYLEEE